MMPKDEKRAAGPRIQPPLAIRRPLGAAWVFALAACLLLVALLGARCLKDFDLGFGLRTGQWIIQHRAVPTTEEYTYTVAGHPYVDSSWLYHVALYALQSAFGYPALTVVNLALLLAVFAITFFRMRLAGTPSWAATLFLGAAVLACEARFQVRAEIVSWLLLATTLLILDLRAARGRNLLFLLPAIQALWVNVEGLFVLGWAAIAAYLASDWLHSRRLDRELARYALLSVAASFLNPYFAKAVALPLTLITRLHGSNLFKQNIVELQSPWSLGPHGGFSFVPGAPLALYKGLSVLALILVLTTLRRRRVHQLLLLPAFFYLSAAAERNTPLFILVAVPLVGACLADAGWKWLRALERRVLCRPASAAAMAAVFLLAGARVTTNAHYLADRRDDRFGLGLDSERLPVNAVRFLAEHRLEGRILNQLNSGGWLLWQAPQKVFIDGQLEAMGEGFFAQYLTAFEPGGLARLAASYGADLIFFNPKAASGWILQLKSMPDWRLVYADGFFLIYARKGYAPEVPELDLRQGLTESRIPPAPADPRAVLGAPRPARLPAWLEGFWRPQVYPERLMDLALVAHLSDRADVAEPIFLEIIRRTRGRYREYFYNLGLVYVQSGRRDLAALCMRRTLEDDPRDELARRVLNDL